MTRVVCYTATTLAVVLAAAVAGVLLGARACIQPEDATWDR